tara:strand:+ start:582 stop:1784 length:1203 start_codon:yes stop_codon:yes gene_type:complete
MPRRVKFQGDERWKDSGREGRAFKTNDDTEAIRMVEEFKKEGKFNPEKYRSKRRDQNRGKRRNSTRDNRRDTRSRNLRGTRVQSYMRPQRRTQKRPQRFPQRRPQRETQWRPQRETQWSPQRRTQRRPQRFPQRRPQRETQWSPQRRTQWSPQRFPQRRPQRETQRRPQRFPQRSPQRETQWRPQRDPQMRPQRFPQRSPRKTQGGKELITMNMKRSKKPRELVSYLIDFILGRSDMEVAELPGKRLSYYELMMYFTLSESRRSNHVWEKMHGSIQWIFPTNNRSKYASDTSPILPRRNREFISKYGEKVFKDVGNIIETAVDLYYGYIIRYKFLEERDDHNFKRITRVANCLEYFNKIETAKKFLRDILSNVKLKNGVIITNETSYRIWFDTLNHLESL